MVLQAIALHRCASCKRWSGQRRSGPDGATVCLDSESACGLCIGGPWDGSERRARSACGHWQIWEALPAKPARHSET